MKYIRGDKIEQTIYSPPSNTSKCVRQRVSKFLPSSSVIYCDERRKKR